MPLVLVLLQTLNQDDNSSVKGKGVAILQDLLGNDKVEELVKYIPVFIIPIIKSLSHSREVTGSEKDIPQILAKLMQLLPLRIAGMDEVEAELKAAANEGYQFLRTLVDNEMVEEYKLEIPVKA